MQVAFDFSVPPFDALSDDERRIVCDHADIAYYPEDATLLGLADDPAHLFVVVSGHVAHFDGDDLIATYGPGEAFGLRALLAGRTDGRFVACDDVMAHLLARDAVRALIGANAAFAAALLSDLSRRLDAQFGRAGSRELQSLALARVDQVSVRPAHFVDAATDIVAVAGEMQRLQTRRVLVREGPGAMRRCGIFTTGDLRRAILDGRPLRRLPVGDLATFPLVTVAPSAALFDALALMIKHRVHGLVVDDGDVVVGVLEQLDVLSVLSNHSYLISVQIVQARDLGALHAAAQQITQLIALLYRGGTSVGAIGRLVQVLNARLFERAWQLVAPARLVANSCLFVMGSEGRGEQLLKTDQDNGLVIRDGFEGAPEIEAASARFSQALRDFGYPDCPGGIMVSNAQWRRSASDFAATVRRWLLVPDAEGLMALAVFIDAHAVAGDARLLAGVRAEVGRFVAADDALLARFAAAIDAFADVGEPMWWSRLLSTGDDEKQIDLKKAGIFPLVHGVRSLALAEGIEATGTIERLDALVRAGRVPQQLANDLGAALHFFMSLKLKAGLAEIDRGLPVSGSVRDLKLSSLERDLLKDALGAVKRFRDLVRHRFHLLAT